MADYPNDDLVTAPCEDGAPQLTATSPTTPSESDVTITFTVSISSDDGEV